MLSAILGSEISKGIQRAIIIVAILAVLLLAAWIYFKSQGKLKSKSNVDKDSESGQEPNAEPQTISKTTSSQTPVDSNSASEQRGTHIKNSRITFVEQGKEKKEY